MKHQTLCTLLGLGLAFSLGHAQDTNARPCCEACAKPAQKDQSGLIAQYPALLDPATLGKQLAIGASYSRYQGVTGVVLPQGENRIIVQGLPEGVKAAIIVPDWLRQPVDEEKPSDDPAGWDLHKKIYPITEGTNTIPIEKEGLAYVSYFSDKPDTLPPITVHFVDGKVNGYFDITKHNNEDWDRLLAQAPYPIIDVLGKHIQIAYPVADLQKFAAGRGVDLVTRYDDMLQRQYDLMGLTKYNRIPQNKLLSRVNYHYYMFRDGDGVSYMGGKVHNAMWKVADPDEVIVGDSCWGFNHEAGHAHQLSPEFCWKGLTEVSNDMMSIYGTLALGNSSRLKERDLFKQSRQEICDKGISLLQCSTYNMRLIPFWQLHLYFTQEGYPDFYPDLYEALRQQHNGKLPDYPASTSINPAVHQLNFVKQVCRVGKTDLTEFFDKYGFFSVGDWEEDDYGPYFYKMTPEMVKKCKEAIVAMNLPKPKIDPSTLEDKD